MKKQCSECRYFVPDEKQPQCRVPLWINAELHRGQITSAEGYCELYDARKDENVETSKH